MFCHCRRGYNAVPVPDLPNLANIDHIARVNRAVDYIVARALIRYVRPRCSSVGDGSKLSPERVSAYLDCVSAAQVIQEIQHLTPTEQAEVIQFAYRLDAERMLSGKELVALAKKMVAATDPAEALEIREQMIRGFYGGKPDA